MKMKTVFAVLAIASVVTAVRAGDLDSPVPPTSAGSAMYTLEDIYNKLDTRAAVTKRTGAFTEPVAAPGSTGHTLNDVMALITNRAPVAKTGQTTSYATGDDGDLEHGVASPSARFVDSDGTITDKLTGLIWLKNANVPNATRNWATALTDVAQLNTDGTMNGNSAGDTSNGGSHQTDWRLPTVREILSLIAYGHSVPALSNTAGTGHWSEGDPFSGVQSSSYWTSTTLAFNTVFAWEVWLDAGEADPDWKTNVSYVWPVRGGD